MRGPYQCCICENHFSGYGHNPQPVDDTEGARCCDRCNSSVVIPARLKNYMLGSESSDKEDAWGKEKTSAILAGVFGIALEGLLNRLEDSVVYFMSESDDKPHEIAYYKDCVDYLCSGMADTLEANSDEMDPEIVGSIVSMLTMAAVKMSSYEQIPEIKRAMDKLDSDSEESSEAIAEIVAEETNEFGESLDIDMWSADSRDTEKCPVCEGTQVLEQMEMKTSDLCLGHSDAFDDLNLDVPYAAESKTYDPKHYNDLVAGKVNSEIKESMREEGFPEHEINLMYAIPHASYAGFIPEVQARELFDDIHKFNDPDTKEKYQEFVEEWDGDDEPPSIEEWIEELDEYDRRLQEYEGTEEYQRAMDEMWNADEVTEEEKDFAITGSTRRESIRESPEYYVHSLDEYFGPYYSIEDAEDGVERLVSKGIYIIGITKGQYEWIQDLTEQEAEDNSKVLAARGEEYLDENFCLHDDVYIDEWEFDLDGFDKQKEEINLAQAPDIDIEDVFSPDIIVTICCDRCGSCQKQKYDIDQVLDIIYERELSLNDLSEQGVILEIFDQMGVQWDDDIPTSNAFSAEDNTNKSSEAPFSVADQFGDIESISRWMRNTANAGTDYDDWYWDGEKLMVYAIDPITGIDTEEEYTKSDLIELGVVEDMFPNMDDFQSESDSAPFSEFQAETIKKFFDQIESLLNKTAGDSWSLDSDGYPEANKLNINISMNPESSEFFEGL